MSDVNANARYSFPSSCGKFLLLFSLNCISSSGHAAIDVPRQLAKFPAASDVVGVALPPPALETYKKHRDYQFLQKFDFDGTLMELVNGKIRGALIRLHSNEPCPGEVIGELGVVTGIAQGKLDGVIDKVATHSDVVLRSREYITYGPSISDEDYAALKKMPVSRLSKRFVTDWLIRNYLDSPKVETAFDSLSNVVWELSCGRK